MENFRNRIYNMDCIAGMKLLPDHCVDLVLTDLPYGTTSGCWDVLLPLDQLWKELHRVAKPNAAMVFTAAQPFTTTLIQSNPKEFRYCWYWIKNQVTGFPFCKFQPLRCVEEIAVFYRKAPTYNPQGLVALEHPRRNRGKALHQPQRLSPGRPVPHHAAALHQLSPPGPHRPVPAGRAAPDPEAGGLVRVPGADLYRPRPSGAGLLYGQRHHQGGLPQCRPGLGGI